MKRNVWHLAAAACFLIAGLIYLFLVEEDRAVGAAFLPLACAFVALYINSGKKTD